MATSDVKLQEWIEALAAEGCDRRVLGDLEADCIGRAGRIRMVRDRAIRDMEIAQLIPRGVGLVIERFGGKKRINQYRASRGRQLLKMVQQKATQLHSGVEDEIPR